MKNEGKSKKVKIICVLVMCLITVGILLYLFFVNREEYTDEVKKYEVSSESGEIRLNILDDITIPVIKADYLQETPLKKIKKDLSMQYILNIIKDYDKTFDIKDYTLSYNGSNISYYFSLRYKIDNKIYTSKGYTIFIKDKNVDYIMVCDVEDKEKIDDLNKLNKSELLKLVSNFKGKYKSKALYEKYKDLFKTDKVLKRNGKVDTSNMTIDIEKIEERFYYDYNEKKLYYEAPIAVKYDDVFAGNVLRIELN
ncbi:MAG: hypothetical protein OSJ70_05805 [Bacilli bacterium]|nr:hypothetical protein [Bacilli bacterium]